MNEKRVLDLYSLIGTAPKKMQDGGYRSRFKRRNRKIIGGEFRSKLGGGRIKVFSCCNKFKSNRTYYYEQAGVRHYTSYYFLKKHWEPV